MDKEFKTTFIPKKNLSSVPKTESVKSKSRRSLFSLLSILLFIVAIISTAVVYVYKFSVAESIKADIEDINSVEREFEPQAILKLKELDIRLQAGTELLERHIAVSGFLESFAASTLPDVSFNDLSFEYDPEGSTVSLSGEARGYLQIAQQSDIYEDNRYIQNHIFQDFAKTDIGRISFSLDFTVNPELLVFGQSNDRDESDIIVPDSAIIEIDNNGDQFQEGEDINFGAFTN